MTIEVSELHGVRFLHFGTPWIQGAMRIARPWSLELEYTRDLMMPLLLKGTAAWPGNVLQVGLGAASVTRFLWKHVPQARLTVAEISPEVVHAARLWFKLPEDPARLAIEIADGRDYVAATTRRFDLVVLDGFDAEGRSGPLDSVAFYQSVRERLTRSGMLSVNLLTRTRGVQASVDRLAEVFGERVVVLPPSEAGNTVALAGAGLPLEESFAELRARAAEWRARTGLDLRGALSRLEARA
jgi:spermidine synthase